MSDTTKEPDASNSIFTKEELELLALTRSVRVDIIKEMIRGGVPDKVNEIRVLNEMALSLDKNITDSANIRIKHTDASNTEATLNIVAEALKSVAKANMTPGEQLIELPVELDVDDFAPGENVIEAEVLDVDDFITTKD